MPGGGLADNQDLLFTRFLGVPIPDSIALVAGATSVSFQASPNLLVIRIPGQLPNCLWAGSGLKGLPGFSKAI